MSGKASPATFAPLGDSAIMVTLGGVIDRELNRRVHACVRHLARSAWPEVSDIVPAYSSFAVHYDPLRVTSAEITDRVRAALRDVPRDDAGTEGSLVTIPVRYDGPDLEAVADATRKNVEEVIALHSAGSYHVYMMGFAPGFAYLGDLDPALHLPRHATPRTRVPRGSVGIAGAQTAVYPVETPGGWHLIGRTDLLLFDAQRDPPALLHSGDSVKFERIE